MTHANPAQGPLAGRLEGISLPYLLAEISRRRATGLLHVSRRNVRRTVQIGEGRVVFSSSSDPNDRLGESLLRAGKVTLSQLEAALSEQSTGKRLGTLMVEAGILSQVDLADAVRGQISAIVLDLLTWSEGDYHFEESPLPTDEEIKLELSTENLLFRAIRGVREMKLIERGVGAPRTVYRLTDDWSRKADGVELTEGARALLDRLGAGQASIETLCREVCCSSFEIYRTIWAFRLVGIAQPVERRSEADPLQGNLVDTSLAPLLIRLENDGETGVLYVTRGTVERSILFAAGRCVFATSNDPDDSLVSFLFRRGVISLRDKEETVRRLLSNKRVGTILRELGAIDDADLQNMVRQQVAEIIYDTIGWEEAEYVFVPGPLPHAEEITLHTTAGALIAEGVRRVTSWTRLMRGCGGVDNPLCLTPRYLEILDAMDASVAEWEVINALKSPQTPRRVCGQSELNDLRICQILWTLKLLGAVEDSPVEAAEDAEFDEARQPEPEAAPEPVGAAPESVGAAPAPVAKFERDLEPVEADGEADSGRETVEEALRALDEPEPEQGLPDLSLSEIDDGSSAAEAEPGRGNGEPASEDPRWEVEPGIEEVILRFNAMHRVVYCAVRSEIGAGSSNFIHSCCGKVKQERDPLEGVELHADGSWDVEDLKRVIVQKDIDDPWPAYQRVLDQEFVSLQPHLGAARADRLKQRIWEIEQAS